MANATDVVGYGYEGALHCVRCSMAVFPALDDIDTEPGDTLDSEGNEVKPVFLGEDAAYVSCYCCGGEGGHEIVGPKCRSTSYVECDECSGAGTVSASCDDCGEELVQ